MSRQRVDDFELGEQIQQRRMKLCGELFPDLHEINVLEQTARNEAVASCEDTCYDIREPLHVENDEVVEERIVGEE